LSLLLSVVIGSLTAGFGAAAEPAETGPGTTPPTPDETLIDWFNFNSDQRLVIVVAVIAAFTIVTAADILGRSMATGKAVSTGLIPFAKPQSAEKETSTRDQIGMVYAVRGGEQPAYLFQGSTGSHEWVPADKVTFTRQ
jgi:hypothetical protein